MALMRANQPETAVCLVCSAHTFFVYITCSTQYIAYSFNATDISWNLSCKFIVCDFTLITCGLILVSSEEEFTLSESVRVCPVCQHSNMVVRKKKDGGFMLSCLGYPECRAVQFFPPCVASAQPHTSLCSNVREVYNIALHMYMIFNPPSQFSRAVQVYLCMCVWVNSSWLYWIGFLLSLSVLSASVTYTCIYWRAYRAHLVMSMGRLLCI